MSSPSSPQNAFFVSPGLLLRVWLMLGLQSFGGGSATLALIRRAVVEQYGWLTDAEFVRDWALCQVTPGINLLGLTILIGRRLGGGRGIVLALAGLLLPSVTVTLLITAFYLHFQNLPLVRRAVQGVIPATVGLGLVTSYQMALPLIAASWREGRNMLGLAVLLLAGSVLVTALWHLPVVAILCGAGLLGALGAWGREMCRRARERQTS